MADDGLVLVNGCDPEKKRRLLGISTGTVARYAGVLLTTIVLVVVFYFTWERDQNTSINDNKTRATKVEERLAGHIENANKTFERSAKIFDKLDATMIRQHQLIGDTRLTLTTVTATQTAIKSNQERILTQLEDVKKEVRKSNGHSPN